METKYITNWFETEDFYIENDDLEEWFKNKGIKASIFFPNNFKDILIPSKYNGHNCLAISVEGFANKSNLETVIIEQGIKYICDNAFYGCKKLSKIYLPNTIKMINPSAFRETNIKEVYFIEGIKYVDLSWFNNLVKYGDEGVVINIPKTVEKIKNEHYKGFIFAIDKENPYYEVNNNFLIDKRNKTILNYNSDIEEITIPKNIKNINSMSCYLWCKNNEFFIPEGVEKIDSFAFEIEETPNNTITIHLPSSMKEVSKYSFNNPENTKIKYVFDNGNPCLTISHDEIIKKEMLELCIEEKEIKTITYKTTESRGNVTTLTTIIKVDDPSYSFCDDSTIPNNNFFEYIKTINKEKNNFKQIKKINEFNKLINQIKNCVKDWKKEYFLGGRNYDGFTWEVKVVFTDDTATVYKGFNQAPENYDEFTTLIYKIKQLNK